MVQHARLAIATYTVPNPNVASMCESFAKSIIDIELFSNRCFPGADCSELGPCLCGIENIGGYQYCTPPPLGTGGIDC